MKETVLEILEEIREDIDFENEKKPEHDSYRTVYCHRDYAGHECFDGNSMGIFHYLC